MCHSRYTRVIVPAHNDEGAIAEVVYGLPDRAPRVGERMAEAIVQHIRVIEVPVRHLRHLRRERRESKDSKSLARESLTALGEMRAIVFEPFVGLWRAPQPQPTTGAETIR
jgi:hypothetical protein